MRSATNPAAADVRQACVPPALVRALELEKEAPPLFRPTPYWAEIYPALLTSLVEGAGEPTRLRWINPVYTGPGEPSRDLDELRRTETANGRRLLGIAEQVLPDAPEGYYADVAGFIVSKPFLKNLRVFSAFLAAVPAGESLTVLELGGGNGALAEIVLKASPHHRYVGVDLALPAWAAHCRLARVLGSGVVVPFEHGLGGGPLEMHTLLADRRAALLPAAALPRLRGHCNLFVNVKSFQEMEPDVVTNYVTAVRRLGPRWALMLNSRDGIGPDARRGKPGTRERVTVASTVAAFGTARRVESPWLDWRHSDNDQELTVLELRYAQ